MARYLSKYFFQSIWLLLLNLTCSKIFSKKGCRYHSRGFLFFMHPCLATHWIFATIVIIRRHSFCTSHWDLFKIHGFSENQRFFVNSFNVLLKVFQNHTASWKFTERSQKSGVNFVHWNRENSNLDKCELVGGGWYHQAYLTTSRYMVFGKILFLCSHKKDNCCGQPRHGWHHPGFIFSHNMKLFRQCLVLVSKKAPVGPSKNLHKMSLFEKK